MIATNRTNSRWRVVILVCSAEDNLAMTPLGFSGKFERSTRKWRERLQNSPISSLNDKTKTGATDAMGTLQSHVFGLENIYEPIWQLVIC